MSIAFFDASALVKLLVPEVGSDAAMAVWDGADALASSRLAYPEVCAALARAYRIGNLDNAGHRRARQEWERLWASLRPIELSDLVARRAAQLGTIHPLSGADAVHLASADVLSPAQSVVATWDRRLHAAARATGFVVAPASLG